MKSISKNFKLIYGVILVIIFGGLFAFLVKMNGNFNRVIPLIGDEPSYMAIADSIVTYKTVNLAKTLEEKHYYSFFPQENSLHTVNLGKGKDFPKHGIGWSIFMAPFFFFGSNPRALIEILQNIVVVLLAYNLFLWLRELKYNFWLSLIVPFILIFSIPIAVQAHMVFSEPVAALALVYAIRKFEKPNWLSILGTLFLPWIHIKYLAFYPMLIWPFLKPRLKYWPMALIVLGVIGIAVFNWYGYGTPFSGQEKSSTFFKTYQGLLGILINREDGLFTSAPIYLISFLGMGSLWFKNRPLFWKIAYPVGILWLITGVFDSWHGGQGPTARMILVTLPLLAPAIAETLVLPLKWLVKTLFIILAIPSLLLGFQGIRLPIFAVDKPLYDNLNILQKFYLPVDFEKFFPLTHHLGWNLNLFWFIILILLGISGYLLAKNQKPLEKFDETLDHYPRLQ